MTNEIKADVTALLRAGDRAKAIGYLEESYQISEEDATTLVEALERETGILHETGSIPDVDTAVTVEESLKAEVAQFLRNGRKLEAVQHVRKHLPVNLRQALVLVEGVAKEVNPSLVTFNVSGCFQMIMKGVGIFLMICSFMLLAAGAIIWFLQYRSISTSDRVTGVVEQMETLDTGASAPVVGFEWRGKKWKYTSTYYSSPPNYTAGQTVPLYVNREDPEDVILDTFSDRWALLVGLGVIGGGLLLISIVFLYFARRKF